jgi:acetyl esterase/lipase
MTTSPTERKIRAAFPVLRLFQAYMPIGIAQRALKRSTAHVRLDANVRRESILANGVPCEWLNPDNCSKDRVLLYLHGGGFVYGLTPQHLHMVAYLARKMGTRALLVDYRLAPDHPFPAALEDCTSAYRWLINQGIRPEDIAVAGDSAGGNLTITTAMSLRDSDDALPAAMACLSPVGDLTNKNNTPDRFKDPLLPPRAVKFYNRSYVKHNDPRNPLISPVYGDWHGLSPLLLHAGEDEILREDSVRIAGLARSAGMEVQLEIFPRMWHVWQLFLELPQAIQSLDSIVAFLVAHYEPVRPQPNPG